MDALLPRLERSGGVIRWLLSLLDPPERPGPAEGQVRADWGDGGTLYRWTDDEGWVRI